MCERSNDLPLLLTFVPLDIIALTRGAIRSGRVLVSHEFVG